MGNKSHKEKPTNPSYNLYSPQLPNGNHISGKHSSIKSILKTGSSRDSSSISSSNSSISKQNVTFVDEIPNSVNSVKSYIDYRNSSINSNKSNISLPHKISNNLSYSTETLKTGNSDWTSTLRSRESIGGVTITYAKDYQINKKHKKEEPFVSDCELMPSYSATFAVRLKPLYHSTVRLDNLNQQSLKQQHRHSGIDFIPNNNFDKTQSKHSLVHNTNQSKLLFSHG